jgi:ribosome-associated protein
MNVEITHHADDIRPLPPVWQGCDTAGRSRNHPLAIEMGRKDAMLVAPPRRGLSARRPEDETLSQDVPSAQGPATTSTEPSDGDQMLSLVLTSLDDDKAEDVISIDLRGRSAIADHMVIASGRSSRQVAAIAEKLAQRVKEATGRSPRIEGKDTGDWVLIDTDDVVVHVFRPEVREFYQLEKMWMPADALTRLREPARPQP